MNRNLYLVFGAIFCLFATQTIAFVLIPLAAAAMGLPGSAIGVLVALLAGLGLVSDVVIGATSDRIGRKPSIVLGVTLGTLAGIIVAVADGFLGLLFGSLVLGLSLSFAVVPALAYVTEAVRPEHAAKVQGYNGAVQGLSALGGAVAVGVVVDRLGPRPSALLISALMAVALLSVLQMEETVAGNRWPSPRELLESYRSAIQLLVARPALQLSVLVSLIFNSVVFVVVSSFLPIYIVRDLGQSAAHASALVATRNLAMTVASPLFGISVRRLGLLATMLGSNAIAVVGMIGLALAPDAQLLYVPLMAAGFGAGFAAATANTLVSSATAPGERALGFATNSLVGRAGSLLSPILYGAVLEISGSSTVFLAAGILGIAYLGAMAARIRFGMMPEPKRLAA